MKFDGIDIGRYDHDGNEITWMKCGTFKSMQEAEEKALELNSNYEKEYGRYPDFESFVHVRPYIGKKYVDDDGEDFPEDDYEDEYYEQHLYTKSGQYLG